MNVAVGAVAMWDRSDGADLRVQASVRPPGGEWPKPDTLSAAGEDAGFAEVALDAAGNAIAVFGRNGDDGPFVQAVGYDFAGPRLSSLQIPAAGTVGEPVTFGVSSFDDFPFVTSWTFGDGGSEVKGNTVSHAYATPGVYAVTEDREVGDAANQDYRPDERHRPHEQPFLLRLRDKRWSPYPGSGSVEPPSISFSPARRGVGDGHEPRIESGPMAHRLLAIVTDDPLGPEPLREIRSGGADDQRQGSEVDLRVVVPAVEASAFRHTLGDIDEPQREAEARLGRVLEELRVNGIEAGGEVGDPDPIQAAQDALLKAPADEVVIFEHEQAQARWFEEGLLEKAEAGLDPPLRMVVLHSDRDGAEHVVDVATSGPGTHDPAEGHEVGSAYLPGLSRGDFAGMVAGIFGTIVVIFLAAAVTVDKGEVTGRAAAAILIAIGIALVNMAHVVGLTLMESVRYRGGFAKFFRALSLIGTPLAVVATLALLIAP